ncbi:MAG TPA: hypothetical protein VN937_07540 [Blastocatellia bacterium]|nr:hypothetical protein [Blastocatellia bacterium]
MNRPLLKAITSPVCRIKKLLKGNAKLAVILTLATLVSVPLFPFAAAPVNWQAQAVSFAVHDSRYVAPARVVAKPMQAGPSRVYNPYWYLDKKTTATLEITNNVEANRILTPVLLVRGTERISLAPVTIHPRETVRLSLKDALSSRLNDVPASGDEQRWGNGTRKRSLWGAAVLEGESTSGISSWIISENPKESLSINSLFDGAAGSAVLLSAMYWRPTATARIFYALQNISDSEMTIHSSIFADGQRINGRRLTVPFGGSLLVDLRELLPNDKASIRLPEVGRVEFIARGGMLGRTIIVDDEVGFSVPLMTHGALSRAGNTLQMPGTPFGRPDRKMGFPKKTAFSTNLLLANTSSNPISVTATLDGHGIGGVPVSWDAPIITLAAFESRVVNLEKARVEGHSPVADGHAGVRLVHTGSPSDLLAEAVTVDQTMTFSFYDPFFDDVLDSRVDNAVSFNLSGNKDTLLVIKNSFNQTSHFDYSISYQDAGAVHDYKSALFSLAPYEVRVVDIKALRDGGVIDREGHRLPINVSFGNARIYADRAILISGDPTFDPVAGTCSSCTNPCPGCTMRFCEPDPDCDPCLYDPSLCDPQQSPACTTCCTVKAAACDASHSQCLIIATGVFAGAVAGCEAGLCATHGEDSTECIACLAGAAAVYTAAIFACDFARDACLANRSCAACGPAGTCP